VKRAVVLTALVAALSAASSGGARVRASEPDAADALLPARHRAVLLLRILVYDRHLADRVEAGAPVVVAVLYGAGEPASERDRDALVEAFEALSGEVVAAGRKVRVRPVVFRGEADLAERLVASRPAVVYACTGLEADALAIARATRRARVLSASGAREMAEAGIAVALVPRGRHASVVVNLAGARAEGAELDAGLLGVAEVLGANGARER